jgi:putative phosphoribosyl transferase
MYFESRVAAGKIIAEKLGEKYQGKKCAVVALNDGGVMVGTQIALKLKCVLTMLMSEPIMLPREDVPIAGISQNGAFIYNNYYSHYQIEEFLGEYFHLIEQEKMECLNDMHRLIGVGGLIRKDLLAGHNIILVSDGLKDGFSIDLAMEYLKPIHIDKVIMAAPLASVAAVDRMHVLANEICCLSVLENYMDTSHYYDTDDVPSHETIIKTIKEVVGHWQ